VSCRVACPTDAEWTSLITYLGGDAIAGGKMKSTGTTLWTDPNEGATNESGFTGLPGGSRSSLADYEVTVWECGHSGGAHRNIIQHFLAKISVI